MPWLMDWSDNQYDTGFIPAVDLRGPVAGSGDSFTV